MEIFSLVLIMVYIGIALIPIIYNHTATSSRRENVAKYIASKTDSEKVFTSRSIIVFLNNLSDEQINIILDQINRSRQSSN